MVLDQYAWEPPDETLSLNQKGAFERRHRVMAPTVMEARISSWALLFLRAPFLKITFTRNLIASAIGAGTLFSIHLKPEKSPTIHRNLENRRGMRMNSIQG